MEWMNSCYLDREKAQNKSCANKQDARDSKTVIVPWMKSVSWINESWMYNERGTFAVLLLFSNYFFKKSGLWSCVNDYLHNLLSSKKEMTLRNVTHVASIGRWAMVPTCVAQSYSSKVKGLQFFSANLNSTCQTCYSSKVRGLQSFL